MNDTPVPEGSAIPPHLRFLKLLVTVLAGTMIVGLITIIGLIVTRFPTATAPAPALPEAVKLPPGVTAEAITFGHGWIAVVTGTDEILILDAATGALRQTVKILPAP